MYEVIANVQAKLESQKCQFWNLLAVGTGTFRVLLPLIVVFLTYFGFEATTHNKDFPVSSCGREVFTGL